MRGHLRNKHLMRLSNMRVNKHNVQEVFKYIKSLKFVQSEVVDACSPLWLRLYKFRRCDEEIHVFVNCILRTNIETSIESITNAHGVSLIKRGNLLLK